MEIKQYTCKYLSSNCYLISENGHCFIIDPCRDEALATLLDSGSLKLDFALLTHEHSDHISGVNWIQERYGAIVVCSDRCNGNLGDVRMNYSLYFDTVKALMGTLGQDESVTMEPFICCGDRSFSGDCSFEWQSHNIFCKLTPGHSQGSVCYLIDGCILFAGDSLFESRGTVTRFKGGSAAEFCEITVPWLESLNPQIQVYPGHDRSFLLDTWLQKERNYR